MRASSIYRETKRILSRYLSARISVARFKSIGMQSRSAVETIPERNLQVRRKKGNRANVLSVAFRRKEYFSVLPFSSLSSFLQRSIVVVELAVETAIIKYFGRDRNVQNDLRIMDPCIFIDTLKKYHCPFIFT